MNFIMIPEHVQQITCMKLSPNKRFLLVAEQHKTNPDCFISVYDMKEACLVAMKQHNITEMSEGRGNLFINGQSVNNNYQHSTTVPGAGPTTAMSNTGGQAAATAMSSANTTQAMNKSVVQGGNVSGKPKIIVDFSFSSIGNNHVICIAITDEIDSKVVVFDWSSGRVIACAEWKRQFIDRVTFNPADEAKELCVSGHNIWAIYSIKDGVKDGILNITNKNFFDVITKARRHISFQANSKIIFTEHCWLDRNRLIGCT